MSASKSLFALPALALALSIAPTPFAASDIAFAAGGGGGASTPTCSRGRTWSRSKKQCVKTSYAPDLPDNDLIDSARGLAYAGKYERVLETLAFARNQQDPRVLNYRGYATRKLGRVEEGLTYYRAALRVDPDYTLVREYMGEAFLMLGQVDKAREQLVEIERRCGTDCREYALLAKEIEAFEKR